MTTPYDPNSGEEYNPADPSADPTLEARLTTHFRTQATAPLDGEAFWERLAPRLEPRLFPESDTIASPPDAPTRQRGTTVVVPDAIPTPPAHGSRQRQRASHARRPRRALNNLLAVAAVLALCLSAFALFHQLSEQPLGKSVLMRRGELTWRRVTLPPGVVLTNGEGVTMTTNGSGTPIISGAVKNAPTPNATLQVTPSNGNIAYICQLAGQGNPRLWRTTDAGQHWNSLPTLHITGNVDTCFLEFDANNPLTVIATFVRSAENGSAHGRVSYVLFHGASQWQALGQGQLMGSVASWRNIYYGLGNLNSDAPTTTDPNGTSQDQPQQRLYESTDQMRTWHELNDAPLIAEDIATAVQTKRIGPNGALALWVQPTTGEMMTQTFAGVLWRSVDHGQHWARILLPALPPASELTPTPGETISEGGATDAIAFVQQPVGNKLFTLCALVLDQTAIAYNVAPFYCSTDSGQSWTRRPRTAVEWGNGKPATFELPQLMLSDGTLLAWDVRTLSVFPGNNASAAAAHVIGTIPTPLNPDNIPSGEASPIPGGAVLWQPHDPQTLYVATYYSP